MILEGFCLVAVQINEVGFLFEVGMVEDNELKLLL